MAEKRELNEMVLITSADRAAQAHAEALAEALEKPLTEVDPNKVFYVTADGRKVKPDGSEYKA